MGGPWLVLCGGPRCAGPRCCRRQLVVAPAAAALEVREGPRCTGPLCCCGGLWWPSAGAARRALLRWAPPARRAASPRRDRRTARPACV
eukprot:6958068-Lingulodinium_polyedra.AAC.1